MMMDEITDALKNVCPNVYYGIADDSSEESYYITWFRRPTTFNANHTSKTNHFVAGYVCKDYVPESAEDLIKMNLEEIPGCRVDNMEYGFAKDATTGNTYEVLQVPFTISKKVRTNG